MRDSVDLDRSKLTLREEEPGRGTLIWVLYFPFLLRVKQSLQNFEIYD